MEYSVRLRDIRTGAERWMEDGNGQRFSTLERFFADVVAYAATDSEAWVLPYVVELDTAAEVPN